MRNWSCAKGILPLNPVLLTQHKAKYAIGSNGGSVSKKMENKLAINVDAPIRPYGESLNKTIAFRVTEDEALRFQDRCNESGWSRADLFRATLLGTETKINYKPVNPRSLPDYRGAAFQIRKAGNNLNQIARIANSAGQILPCEVKILSEGVDAVWLWLKSAKGEGH